MDINLFGLQKQTIESYNSLVYFLKRCNTNPESGFVKVDGEQLERYLEAIHNNLAFVGSLIDPDTGKAFLDGEKVLMDCFVFEPEEEHTLLK